MKTLLASITAFLMLILLAPSAQAQGQVTVSYTVDENGTVVLSSCSCPSYGGQAAYAGSWGNGKYLGKEAYQDFNILLADFSGAQNGRTRNRQNPKKPDANITTVTGPLNETAQKLCDLIRNL